MLNNEDDTEEQEETPKPAGGVKQKIIDKLKSSPVTVVAVLAGAMALMVGVVIATVVYSHRPDMPAATKNNTVTQYPEAPEPETPPEVVYPKVTYGEFANQVKLVLFEQGLTGDAMSESFADGINYINITVPQDKTAVIIQGIVSMLARNQLHRFYSAEPNHVVTGTDKWQAEVIVEPSAVTPPVRRTSAAQPSSNPYGLTPPKRGRGEIALLIDDAGINMPLADRLTKIDAPMAIAVLPHLQFSSQTAELVRSRGKTVFLHLPMEPLNYPLTDPGAGAVLLTMPESLIGQIVTQNVESLGNIIDGANNHMGSAITQDREKMKQVLSALRSYTNHYVDSNTSPRTVAYTVCQEEEGFACGINRKFIDNESERSYIAGKLYEAAQQAEGMGGLIVIGHLRPDTVSVLEYVVPELQKLGYSFVTIQSLMK